MNWERGKTVDVASRWAKIRAIEYCLPEGVINNHDLEKEFESWSAEEIYDKTGIANRHVASEGECASDLGVRAVKKLIQQDLLAPQEVDILIFCTQTPDYYLPTTSCTIQERVGLPTSCAAFDVNLGCSGYIYALAIANAFIVSKMAENVLVVTGDTYSKLIHPGDKSTRTLFGDAGTATYLNGESGVAEITGEFVLGTDGSGAEDLIVPAGGFRTPKSIKTAEEYVDEKGNTRSKNNLYMNGPQMFASSLKTLPQLIDTLLVKNEVSLEQIDWFVFYKSSKFAVDCLIRSLDIPQEKLYIYGEDCGNTVSSSIPITLKAGQKKGIFKEGNLIMLVGFGTGYSWGANILRWIDGT